MIPRYLDRPLNDLKVDVNSGGWYWLDNNGKRSNDSIMKMLYNDVDSDTKEHSEDSEQLDMEINMDSDNIQYPLDPNEKGLVIGSEEPYITKHSSHPYGFDTPPVRTFRDDPRIRTANNTGILTYEKFKNNL